MRVRPADLRSWLHSEVGPPVVARVTTDLRSALLGVSRVARGTGAHGEPSSGLH